MLLMLYFTITELTFCKDDNWSSSIVVRVRILLSTRWNVNKMLAYSFSSLKHMQLYSISLKSTLIMKSNGQQFHQYKQSEQPPLVPVQ